MEDVSDDRSEGTASTYVRKKAAASPRDRRDAFMKVAAVGLVGLAVLAFFTLRDDGPSNAITGTITVRDSEAGWQGDGEDCDGTSKYDDARPGDPVRVTDGTGKEIATGSLRTGQANVSFACAMPYTVEDVPKADTYVIQVGDHEERRYSYEEMTETRRWVANFPLEDLIDEP